MLQQTMQKSSHVAAASHLNMPWFFYLFCGIVLSKK